MAEGTLAKNFFFGRNNSSVYLTTQAGYDFFYGVPQRQKQLISLAKAQLSAQRDAVSAIERSNSYLAQEIRQVGANLEASINRVGYDIVTAVEHLEFSLLCEFREVKWLLEQIGDYLHEIIKILKNKRKFEANELLNQALTNLKKGYYGEAEERLLKALDYDNTDFQIHRNLGFIYIHKDDAEKALEHFQKSVSFSPTERLKFEALGDLARIFYAIEKYQQAAETSSMLINLANQNPDIVKDDETARSWYMYGVYWGLANNIDACIKGIDTAINLKSHYYALSGIDRELDSVRDHINAFLKIKADTTAKQARANFTSLTHKRNELKRHNGKYAKSVIEIDKNINIINEKLKNTSYTDLIEIKDNCDYMIKALGLIIDRANCSNQVHEIERKIQDLEKTIKQLDKEHNDEIENLKRRENAKIRFKKWTLITLRPIVSLVSFIIPAVIATGIIYSLFSYMEGPGSNPADSLGDAFSQVIVALIMLAVLFASLAAGLVGPFYAFGLGWLYMSEKIKDLSRSVYVSKDKPYVLIKCHSKLEQLKSQLHNLENKIKDLSSQITKMINKIVWSSSSDRVG